MSGAAGPTGGRNLHYEAAFEDYLRGRQAQYVAVDETHRTIFTGVRIKSFDFLVYGAGGENLIVDVKGRRVQKSPAGTLSFQNWVTADDIEGLRRWEEVFGAGFAAVLMFAFWMPGPPGPADEGEPPHLWEGAFYRFQGIRLRDYAAQMRDRSPKWKTVHIPTKFFRDNSRPAHDFL